MTILLLALLVTATTFVLVRTISSDGYGHRPVPRSNVDTVGPRHHVL